MCAADFRIGTIFTDGVAKWKCTDVGTRTIAAIRIDSVEVDGSEPRTLDEAEATAMGWFAGPPYAVDEEVFDEDMIEGCQVLEQPDVNGAEKP